MKTKPNVVAQSIWFYCLASSATLSFETRCDSEKIISVMKDLDEARCPYTRKFG